MAKENKSPVSKKVEDIKPEDKRKALETALTQIKKQFGEGAVMRLGQNNGMHVDAISTGSLSLDLALGIGGLPRGRIIEIYGPESSGKTTLALHCVAEGQKMGGNAAFIDVEHALDPVYASALGVDVDSLLVSQPDTGEQALEITEALVRSNALAVLRTFRPARGDRGRNGRQPCRLAGAFDVAGVKKACRCHLEVKLRRHFHQPAARKSRRCLRQPGGHTGRPRTEILLLRASRCAQEGGFEERYRHHRLPHKGQGW